MPKTSLVRDFATRVVALLGSLFVVIALVASPPAVLAQETPAPAPADAAAAPAAADDDLITAAAADSDDDVYGPGSVTYRDDGAVIKFNTALAGAGRGQKPGTASNLSDGPCVINEKNGYALGDESPEDNNMCAGDKATYQLSFSVETGPKDRELRLTPFWETIEALPGQAAPTQSPEIVFDLVATTGVTYKKNTDGSYTFNFKQLDGATYAIAWKGTASTKEPRSLSQKQGGTYGLGVRVEGIEGKEVTELGVAHTERKLNVLEANRYDQQILVQNADPVWTTFGGDSAGSTDFSPTAPAGECIADDETGAQVGTRYRGVSAKANLPRSWNEVTGVIMPKVNGKEYYNKHLGITNSISADQLTRATLDLAGADWGKEVLAFYDGKPVETKLDDKGNPYIDARYTSANPKVLGGLSHPALFKFYIPENRLQLGANSYMMRMDVVDAEGNPTKSLESLQGDGINVPPFAGNAALGNNVVDPGNGQECSVSTADAAQGSVEGRGGIKNNNCGKTTITVEKECVPGDKQCGVTQKFDSRRNSNPSAENVDWVSMADSNLDVEPLDQADVKIILAPDAVKQDPRICIGWTAGDQYVAENFLKGPGGGRLQDAFPNAKIYLTTESGDGTNCDKLNWETVYDADKGINRDFNAVVGSLTKISGFYIALPGVKLSERPITIQYMVKGANPTNLEAAPKAESKAGGTYSITKNYATVTGGCMEPKKLESRILFSRPKAGVSKVDLSYKAPEVLTLGRQKYVVKSVPGIKFVNGLNAVNSTILDTDNKPVQVVHRTYLSKCLDVDVDLLPKNSRFIGGPASDDPSDCGFDANRYIEQTWALGTEPSTDPYNQPWYTPEEFEKYQATYLKNPATSDTPFSGKYFGTKQNLLEFPVFTPVWAAPNNHFKVLDTWSLTGTPNVDPNATPFTDTLSAQPGQDVKVISKVTWGPKGQPEPAAYEPLDSQSNGIEITIPAVDVVLAQKAAMDSLVPVNNKFTHAVNIQNQTKASFGPSDYIDLLPYNGDGRGTKYSGEYWLEEMPRYAGDDQSLPIEYTTAPSASISQCPPTASEEDLVLCQAMAEKWGRSVDAKRNDSTWEVLTPEVIEKQRGPNKGPRITALRFQSKSFVSEANRTYYIPMGTDRNNNGDIYANSIGVVSISPSEDGKLQGAPGAPAPDAVETEVYSGLISGTIYEDKNRDGDDNDGDIPAPTAHVVKLLRCYAEADGSERCDERPYAETVVPAGQGDYAFDNLPAGNYKVVVTPASDQEINTESGKDKANVGSWTSGTLIINGFSPVRNGGEREAIKDVDFGYYVAEPKITLDKTVNDPEVGRDLDGDATFTLEGKNAGDVPLTEVVLKDVFVRDPQLELECVYFDAAGQEMEPVASDEADDSLTAESTDDDDDDDGEVPMSLPVRAKRDLSGSGASILDEPGINLGVGEGYRCTAVWPKGSITQEDIDKQTNLLNTATITGKYNSRVVDDKGEAKVPLVERKPHLTLTKKVDNEKSVEKNVGEKAQFTIAVVNDGNVSMNHVAIDDDFGGKVFTEPLTCVFEGTEDEFVLGTDTLAPGEEILCSATYEVTQADLDAQRDLPNKATPKGDYFTTEDNRAPFVGDPDTATIVIPKEDPAIEVVKAVRNLDDDTSFDRGALAGNNERVEYQVVFTNTGKVTLRDVTFEDVNNGTAVENATIRCEDSEGGYFPIDGTRALAPGKTITCTYVLTTPGSMIDTQEDMVNRVAVTGTATNPRNPDESTTVTGEDSVTVTPKAQSPGLTIDKFVGADRYSATEETIERGLNQSATFAITLRNTGNTTLSNVVVKDEWAGRAPLALNCDNGWNSGDTLGAGDEVVCYATYEVTQDDIDNQKELPNTASATGESPQGELIDGGEATATVTVPAIDGELKLVKMVDGRNSKENVKAGDVVTWTARITNESNVRATKVKFTDDFRGVTFTCKDSDNKEFALNGEDTLEVGKTLLCSGQYTVTQADVDEGVKIENIAQVNYHKGNPDNSPEESLEDPADISPVPTQPAIKVVKAAREESAPIDEAEPQNYKAKAAGEKVLFDFWVTNTGNTTLHRVNLVDTFDYNGEGSYREGAAATPAFTCFDGETEVNPAELEFAPGAKLRCTLNEAYEVTQADVNVGRDIVNLVEVTAGTRKDPADEKNVAVEDKSTATVTMPPATPSIKLTKRINGKKAERVEVGQEGVFTITVENRGNVTLTKANIVDSFAEGRNKPALELRECTNAATGDAIDPANFTFNPGEIVTCVTSGYQVTQDDLEYQVPLENTAEVTAVFDKGNGQEVPVNDDDEATITVPGSVPNMELVKTVAGAKDGNYRNTVKRNAGESAFFRITGGNTGNVTLRNVTLADKWAKEPALSVTCAMDADPTRTFVPGDVIDALAPGEMFTCVAEYPVTQDDQDAQESLRNDATLTGTYTNGYGVETPLKQDSDATVVMRDADGHLTLNKTVNDAKDVTLASGGAANWVITGTNDGNVTLTDVKLGDTYPKGKDKPTFECDIDGTAFDLGDKVTLAPGQSFTCRANVPDFVTIDDVVAGDDLVNTADVSYSYTNADGDKVTDTAESSATVHVVDAQPAFELVKTVDYDAQNPANKSIALSAGETAYFQIVGTNTGNVPLEDVRLDDVWAKGKAKLDCGDFRDGKTLAVGDKFTCTFAYEVTADDVEAGKDLPNTVTMTAKFRDTDLEPKSDTATVTVPATETELRLDKKLVGERKDPFVAGDRVSYEFVVTNSGTTTLHGAEITDQVLTSRGVTVDCPDVEIPANGGTVTCTSGELTLTAEDAKAGKLVNTATATALRPNQTKDTPVPNRPTSNPDVETVTVGLPTLAIEKSALNTAPVLENGNIVWRITVENNSQLPVEKVKIADEQLDVASDVECHPGTERAGAKLKPGNLGTLNPGEKATCWLTVPLKKAPEPDEFGEIHNTAAVNGLYGDTPVYAEDSEPTDAAVVRVVTESSLKLDKAVAEDRVYKEGEKVTYTFTLTNTGKVSITDLTVDDPMLAEKPFTCAAGPLEPGTSVTCPGPEYTITEADARAGRVTNVAVAQGVPAYGKSVQSNPDRETIRTERDPDPAPSMSLVKEITGGDEYRAGDLVTYTFTVTNTGNTPIEGVKVIDPMLGEPIECGDLPLNKTITCSGTYTVKPEDNGMVRNTAHAESGDVVSNDSTATFYVPKPLVPGVKLDKAIVGGSVYAVGENVTYTFTVTNTGDVDLHRVEVTDPMFGGVVCAVDSLPVGATATCGQATHPVTVADQEARTVVNTAVVGALDPNDQQVPGNEDTATFTVTQAQPALELAKAIDGGSEYAVGAEVTYTFTVTNTGDVDLHDVMITDRMFGEEPFLCKAGTLPKGESMTCDPQTHKVTEADKAKGTVVNVATASAKDPAEKPVASGPATAEFRVTPDGPSSLELAKAIKGATEYTVGDTVTYEFTVTNTGDVDLHDVMITDRMFGEEPFLCKAGTLPKGESMTCEPKTHTVSEADKAKGTVVNVATASAKDPAEKPVASGPATAEFRVPAEGPSSIALEKTIKGATEYTVGDTVTYEFTVTNTGNTPVSNVMITDLMFGEEPFECGATTLAPKAKTTCEKTHKVTEADAKAVTVVNVAQASATGANGRPVQSNQANAKFTVPPAVVPGAASLKLTKAIDGATEYAEGELVKYVFTLENTGLQKLTNVHVDDPMFTSVECLATELAPGETTTCTATHVVSGVDAAAKTVINTATAAGEDEFGATVESNPDKAVFTVPAPVVVPANSSIALVKSIKGGTEYTVDQLVTYEFTVTNTGETTLKNVTVADRMFGEEPFVCVESELAPGATTTCEKTHKVTEADAKAGKVVNVASAAGVDPSGTQVNSTPAIAEFTVPAAPGAPRIALEKTINGVNQYAVGEKVTYTFTVTNTGAVDLDKVVVSDPMFGEDFTCGEGALKVGESTTCTKTHIVTEADAKAGTVVNVATAKGVDPKGTPVSSTPATAEFTVPAPGAPSIAIDKAITGGTVYTVGEKVTYTFTVTNTGAVDLDKVVVSDPMFGEDFTCGEGALKVGESTTCTKTHIVTEADAKAGTVVNVATAKGVDAARPELAVVSAPDHAEFTVPAPVKNPAIGLKKTIKGNTSYAVGDTVTYEFTVTNTGDVDLVKVVVSDAMFGDTFTCGEGELKVGESTTCTKTHKVTEADAAIGRVVNTATAKGLPVTPNGTEVTSPVAEAEFTVPTVTVDAPALALVKRADQAGPVKEGQSLTYTFTVTNTGNTTLENIRINDPKVGAVTCEATTLEPGQSTTCRSSEYTVTAKDAADGAVVNVATATGTTGETTVTSNESESRVPAGKQEESSSIPLWPLLPGLLIPAIIGGGSSTPTPPAPPAAEVPAQPAPQPQPQQPAQPAPATKLPEKGIPRTLAEVRYLANTGASVIGVVGGGAILIVLGSLLVGASRRRKQD
ncbi:DUF11 domain-containing protein [Corynebacterium sp. 13CS0277]|uniref:DUF7507 domain-containing protein n=1 Tax=Corynebacterium sp. 13CS0277 TaxID=2071994 RepID=UPI0011B228A2|nr:DUF11 domain-containing protein [Corynebacterium sp. 13CS0277]